MESHKNRVLVVDDDPGVLRFIDRTLDLHGFTVITAADGKTALHKWETENPGLVLLDIGLPDMNGLEVCSRLRAASVIPIIMITGRGSDRDIVAGLEAGADDYLPKPFAVSVLVARVRAVLRRAQVLEDHREEQILNGGLLVDWARRRVTWQGKPVSLTPTEFRLVACLAQYRGRVRTTAEILTEVWGPEYMKEAYILRTTIGRLRKKIEPDPSNPALIITEPGVGYLMPDFATPKA